MSLLKSFSTASVACGCCSKTASKKSPAGGKTPCFWSTNKFQNRTKKLPNVTSETHRKGWFFSCGCCSKTASKKSPAGGKTPCLWRTNKFQNRAKKLPNVTSETHRKGWFFSYFFPLLLLLLLLLMLLLFKRQLPDWKAPWTNKFQNHAKKLPNVSSEILEKQPFSTASVACGCCSKTASKNHLPGGFEKIPAGGKTPCLWRTKFQNRAKKLPNVTSETHRKGWFFSYYFPLLLLLLLLLLMLLLFKRQLPDWKAPWTNKFQNHAKKLPNVSSEILEKQHFSTASVACGCYSKTASKKSPARGKTPCLWRTNKFQNRAKKLPNVTSETHRKGLFFSYFFLLLLLLLLLLMLLLFKRQLPDWKAPCSYCWCCCCCCC